VSTAGRLKSARTGHEKLLKPRWVEGRMLVGDKQYSNLTVHLSVLRAFRPGITGDPIFIDGDPRNCCLDNLQWRTIDDRRQRASAMAEQSDSRWGAAFAAYWRGDNHALDTFYEEMRRLLIVMVPRKIGTWSIGYQLEVDDVIYTVLAKVFFQVHAATLISLDNMPAYVCTVADRVLAAQWQYARHLDNDTRINRDGEEYSVADAIGFFYPSAELEAMHREI